MKGKEIDIYREAILAEQSLVEEKQKKPPERKGPFIYIASLFLLLLVVLMIVPYYAIKQDPSPKRIPTIDEVELDPILKNFAKKDFEGNNYNKNNNNDYNKEDNEYKDNRYKDYIAMLAPNDQFVKLLATKVATYGCDSSTLCQAKAVFLFVRENFIYVSETDNYLQSPYEMIYTRGGDCDDHAILAANLMRAIGVPTRYVFVPGHVYIDIYIADAPEKYKGEDGWISIDPTCKTCEFGRVPKRDNKMYLY
ncbi:MAG: transglutaminase-like domain-containing protein [Candidatus Woesearchaeota archaeon]